MIQQPRLITAVLCSLVLASPAIAAADKTRGDLPDPPPPACIQPTLPERTLPPPPAPPECPMDQFKCGDREACLWDEPGFGVLSWATRISDEAGGRGWRNLPWAIRREASSAKNHFANRVVRFSKGFRGIGKRICLRAGENRPQLGRAFDNKIRSYKVSKLGGSCPTGGA